MINDIIKLEKRVLQLLDKKSMTVKEISDKIVILQSDISIILHKLYHHKIIDRKSTVSLCNGLEFEYFKINKDNKMDNFQKIMEMKSELMDYADLTNDEFGEACILLCEFHDRIEYINNDKLKEVLEKEIKGKLDYFLKNTKITKTTITETREITELEWINQ